MSKNILRARSLLLSLCLPLALSATAQAECVKTDSGSPYKTSVGCNALASDKGEANTAAGFKALQYNTTGAWNAATGTLALQYNTTGSYNTATGAEALLNNTTGIGNTATGFLALAENTIGEYNTATGFKALHKNTTGGSNTATGTAALYSNTTGQKNTAVGFNALISNTGPAAGATGDAANAASSNTAIGYLALANNTTGWQNTAVGESVLTNNTMGAHNTGIGEDSLFRNETGIKNTATGESSLYENKTGSYNVANGYYALNKNTGDYNVAVGYQAGIALTSGSHNIYIGSQGAASESYTTRIGAQGKHIGAYIAGITDVTVPGGVTVYISPTTGQLGTISSSERFKRDIQTLGSTSQTILSLRPVSFRYKQADEKGAHPLQYGLIAEEVAKVFPDLVQYDEKGAPFSVYYHFLTPLLLAELQHQHAAARHLREEVASLRSEATAQAAQIASFEKKLISLQRFVRADAN